MGRTCGHFVALRLRDLNRVAPRFSAQFQRPGRRPKHLLAKTNPRRAGIFTTECRESDLRRRMQQDATFCSSKKIVSQAGARKLLRESGLWPSHWSRFWRVLQLARLCAARPAESKTGLGLGLGLAGGLGDAGNPNLHPAPNLNRLARARVPG